MRRDQLQTELTSEKIQSILGQNIEYLTQISRGEIKTQRSLLQNPPSEKLFFFNGNFHPFTAEQYDTTLLTLRTLKLVSDNKPREFLFRVLLPEALVKIYSDNFKVGITEAEHMMVHTPLR